MSRWPRYTVRASRGPRSGQSSGGPEKSTSGRISTIGKRAKPTPSVSRTVPRVWLQQETAARAQEPRGGNVPGVAAGSYAGDSGQPHLQGAVTHQLPGRGSGERAPTFAGVHPRYDLSRWVWRSKNLLKRGRWYRMADEALSAIHPGLAARAEKVEGGEDVEQYGGHRSTGEGRGLPPGAQARGL